MKYMLLIYDNPGTREIFAGEAGTAMMADIEALMAELTASGELLGAEGLADPSQTKTVRVRDGATVITDGPFAEAKEHLGGYLIVECERPERATAIAARWPNAAFCAMEVRPLMVQSGDTL